MPIGVAADMSSTYSHGIPQMVPRGLMGPRYAMLLGIIYCSVRRCMARLCSPMPAAASACRHAARHPGAAHQQAPRHITA